MSPVKKPKNNDIKEADNEDTSSLENELGSRFDYDEDPPMNQTINPKRMQSGPLIT
jgi:hypothetical protein